MSEGIILDDGLPLVGEDRGNRSLWIGLATIAICGALLFALIESNRQSHASPEIAAPNDYAIASVPRPELLIPEPIVSFTPQSPLPDTQPLLRPVVTEVRSKLPPVQLARARAANTSLPKPSQLVPQPDYPPQPQSLIQPTIPDPGRSAPVIVHDAVQAAVAAMSNVAAPGSASLQATTAVAVGGGDRTNLVSQGTLIFAVLETAIDSTQSGQVRALISTPVYNALGNQVLIPKGSRIFGEYKGDLGTGQNRAQIIWTRLIRPDGATISLDSPASDQLGRAGVKGRVNTHFGARLLNALLQSSIDFGVATASRAVTSDNGIIVALPAATQGASSGLIQPPPKPTLRVRHGTRISVFVARDLDFSGVE